MKRISSSTEIAYLAALIAVLAAAGPHPALGEVCPLAETKLIAVDTFDGGRFARTVSISGDILVVGADLDDAAAVEGGAAYVYQRGTGAWTQQAQLIAFDAANLDWLGYSRPS